MALDDAARAAAERDAPDRVIPDLAAAPTRCTVVRAADGSRKYRFASAASRTLGFEAAYFHVPGREREHIACVSTQLGCAVGCVFCSTAREPFHRQLSAREIALEIDSILAAPECGGERNDGAGFEISFMGMGEPLANLDAVLAAIEHVRRRYPRVTRVSISTAGPAARVDALSRRLPAALPIHLQLSLHATSDALRRKLVPRARGTLEALLAAGARYHAASGDHVCLNYVLLEGLNDQAADVEWLARLDRRAFYVKITELNAVPGMPSWCKAPTRAALLAFADALARAGVPRKVFVGDGLDVHASCGQLAARPRELDATRVRLDAESAFADADVDGMESEVAPVSAERGEIARRGRAMTRTDGDG